MDETKQLNEARLHRDSTALSLVAMGHSLAATLCPLSTAERDAVVALVAVGQAIAIYARGTKPDREIIESFERTLATLAPVLAVRLAASSPVLGCRDETAAYAAAVSRCVRRGKNPRDECERASVAEAVAEIACLAKRIELLKEAIGTFRGQNPRRKFTDMEPEV